MNNKRTNRIVITSCLLIIISIALIFYFGIKGNRNQISKQTLQNTKHSEQIIVTKNNKTTTSKLTTKKLETTSQTTSSKTTAKSYVAKKQQMMKIVPVNIVLHFFVKGVK